MSYEFAKLKKYIFNYSIRTLVFLLYMLNVRIHIHSTWDVTQLVPTTCPFHLQNNLSPPFLEMKKGSIKISLKKDREPLMSFFFCVGNWTRCPHGNVWWIHGSMIFDLVCRTFDFLVIPGYWWLHGLPLILHRFKIVFCPVCMPDPYNGLRSHIQTREEDDSMVWCVTHSFSWSAFGEMPCSCPKALYLGQMKYWVCTLFPSVLFLAMPWAFDVKWEVLKPSSESIPDFWRSVELCMRKRKHTWRS
jgi:hypothetical protein